METPRSFSELLKPSSEHLPTGMSPLQRVPARSCPSLPLPITCIFSPSSICFAPDPTGLIHSNQNNDLHPKIYDPYTRSFLQAHLTAFKGRERKQEVVKDTYQEGSTIARASPTQLGLGNIKDQQAGKWVRKGPRRLQKRSRGGAERVKQKWILKGESNHSQKT